MTECTHAEIQIIFYSIGRVSELDREILSYMFYFYFSIANHIFVPSACSILINALNTFSNEMRYSFFIQFSCFGCDSDLMCALAKVRFSTENVPFLC